MKIEMQPNTQEVKKNHIEIDLGDLGKHNLEILSKSNFEYPEAIQKETGIIGYERTIISKEILKKIHEDTYRENGKKITEQILNLLSEGEFFHLARHEMGGYAGWKEKEVYSQNFSDQKFILQKIFDIVGIENLNDKKDTATFSHGATDGNQIEFSLFEKNNLKVVKERISPTQLSEYKEKIDSGEIFLCTTNGGLSDRNKATLLVMSGGDKDEKFNLSKMPNLFFDKSTDAGREHFGLTNDFPVSPIFAFDPSSSHLHKYFLDVFDLYISLNKANHTNVVGADSDVLLNLYEKVNYKEILAGNKNVSIDTNNIFKEIDKEWEQDKEYKEVQKFGTRWESEEEGSIPIIIGHDKIKQLRWGDSKYAVFFTEKGLNFLKIKHTDEDKVEKLARTVLANLVQQVGIFIIIMMN